MKTTDDDRERLKLLFALDQQRAECRDLLAEMTAAELARFLEIWEPHQNTRVVRFALLGLALTMSEQDASQ